MAFIHGKGTKILLDKYNLSGFFRGSSISDTTDSLETTTYGNDDKTYLAGLGDGTLSLDGLWDGSVAAVDDLLKSWLKTTVGQTITIGQAGMAIGRPVRMLQGEETGYTIDDPVGDLVTVTAGIQANGGIERGISLHDTTAETVALNFAPVDNGAATTNGFVAHFHLIGLTGSNVHPVAQHSTDNITYVDLADPGLLTTTQAVRIVGTGTVNRWTRGVIASGTFSNVVVPMALARR
jgi:hypothetical protein